MKERWVGEEESEVGGGLLGNGQLNVHSVGLLDAVDREEQFVCELPCTTRGILWVGEIPSSVCPCSTDDVLSGEEVTELMVSAGAYLYLPCPVTSYHAVYSWKHEERDGIACTVKDGSCPLMFDGHMPVSDGYFTCFATEDGLEERVATYFVRLNSGSRPGQGGTTLALALGMAALCSML